MSLVWSRFENYKLDSSNHWLPEVALAMGTHHTLSNTIGAEWGARFAYRGTPRETMANRYFSGVDRDGVWNVSLVMGLTYAP